MSPAQADQSGRIRIAEFAETYDVTNSRLLQLCSELGIKASRPNDWLSPADASNILASIGYSDSLELTRESASIDPLRPRLAGLRVRHYRSVSDIEIVEVPSPLTIVGPNNSGKTN